MLWWSINNATVVEITLLKAGKCGKILALDNSLCSLEMQEADRWSTGVFTNKLHHSPNIHQLIGKW